MTSVTSFDYWEQIAHQLKNNYTGKYIHTQSIKQTNPLYPVTPYFDRFFGPKVLTILIISHPKDDEDKPWDEDAIADSISKIQKLYPKWTRYLVDIWTDFVQVTRAEKKGDGGLRQLMEDSESRLQEICDTLQDYGFRYKGRIELEEDSRKLSPDIDDFYAGRLLTD